MDFSTINQIAHIRQQEILETAAYDRQGTPVNHKLREQLGRLLINAGHRLVDAASAPLPERSSVMSQATTENC